jgi:hypothetical protein
MTTTKKTPVKKAKTTRKKAPAKKAQVKKAVIAESVDDLPNGDGISTEWLIEDRTPEDRRKTKELLQNSTIQFRLLRKILEKKFRDRPLVSKIDLDKSNLDLRIVYNEGYREALQEIYRLLP